MDRNAEFGSQRLGQVFNRSARRAAIRIGRSLAGERPGAGAADAGAGPGHENDRVFQRRHATPLSDGYRAARPEKIRAAIIRPCLSLGRATPASVRPNRVFFASPKPPQNEDQGQKDRVERIGRGGREPDVPSLNELDVIAELILVDKIRPGRRQALEIFELGRPAFARSREGGPGPPPSSSTDSIIARNAAVADVMNSWIGVFPPRLTRWMLSLVSAIQAKWSAQVRSRTERTARRSSASVLSAPNRSTARERSAASSRSHTPGEPDARRASSRRSRTMVLCVSTKPENLHSVRRISKFWPSMTRWAWAMSRRRAGDSTAPFPGPTG